MSMVRTILKEIGGRMMNAGGGIDSSSNMFRGSQGNAPSDKIADKLGMGGGNSNPIMKNNSGENDSTTAVKSQEMDKIYTSSTDESSENNANVSDAGSDEKLKTNIKPVSVTSQETYYTPSGGSSISGILKDLKLDPTKLSNKNTSSGSVPSQTNLTEDNISDNNADIGSEAGDMSDMSDMADAAS